MHVRVPTHLPATVCSAIAIIQPHPTDLPTCLQEINQLQTTLGPLGNSGEGMPGAMNAGCRLKVLQSFWDIIGREYEFVDVGANSGVMLLTARGMGASLAVGLEVRSALGPQPVYDAFCKAGSRHNVAVEGTVANFFETAVGPRPSGQEMLKTLPSLQREGGSVLPVGVYCFSDGFSEGDREHLFFLVASNSNVRAFMCSPGLGKGDRFSKARAILAALNQAASACCTAPFKHHSQLAVKMEGGSQKTVHMFYRPFELKLK